MYIHGYPISMKYLIESLISFLKDPHYRSLLGASILILLGGALFYHLVEGWRFVDSLYFAAITLTTIGFGDFVPKTDAGKIFTVVYIGIGVGLILGFINAVYSHFGTNKPTGATKIKKDITKK